MPVHFSSSCFFSITLPSPRFCSRARITQGLPARKLGCLITTTMTTSCSSRGHSIPSHPSLPSSPVETLKPPPSQPRSIAAGTRYTLAITCPRPCALETFPSLQANRAQIPVVSPSAGIQCVIGNLLSLMAWLPYPKRPTLRVKGGCAWPSLLLLL